MQAALPLSMMIMFPVEILSEHLPTDQFSCVNVKASDAFFDSVIFK
jgi:hypothetical protein